MDTITTTLNGMVTLMLAKFMLNDLPHAAGVTGTRGTEVGYIGYSKEAKQKVESAEGFVEFVLYHLRALSEANQRTLGLSFMTTEHLAAYAYGPLALDPRVADMWKLDEPKVRKYLPSVVAHEYRHFLTVAKKLKIPYPKGPKWKIARQAYEEEAADDFAEEYTGVSSQEARTAMSELWRAVS